MKSSNTLLCAAAPTLVFSLGQIGKINVADLFFAIMPYLIWLTIFVALAGVIELIRSLYKGDHLKTKRFKKLIFWSVILMVVFIALWVFAARNQMVSLCNTSSGTPPAGPEDTRINSSSTVSFKSVN